MTDLSAETKALAAYRPQHKVRFVTAASLFDGHDAAINIMRRILQGMGAEVIHLGHNRSVDEVVTAALQEDAQGIAVSSYQGGHVEYFKYMVELLQARGGEGIQVFGGGGGVIVPGEIRDLAARGVRIYSPEDGQRMGLAGMIGEMLMRADADLSVHAPTSLSAIAGHGEAAWRALAQLITALDNGRADSRLLQQLREQAQAHPVPVIGITGTGGAGKSSLTDELIRRLRLDQNDALRIAVISIDPSRRKSGGALLGDRIRMNAIGKWSAPTLAAARTSLPPEGALAASGRPGGGEGASNPQRVFMRSMATRDYGSEISQALPDVIAACKCAGFDLIVVETSGIGQGDAAIVPLVDVPMYVMTPEFGAASQLEKIDMLDFADFVAINKFDRKGAARCAARRRQAGAAQPRGVQAITRRDAGVRHHGQPLQRRRRDRAVPGREGAPGAGRIEASAGAAAAGGHAPQHAPGADRAGRARALPGRDRRHGARLQASRARAGGAGARDPAAARERAHAARRGRQPRRCAQYRAPVGRRARGPTRPDRKEAADDVARHARAPTPATNT